VKGSGIAGAIMSSGVFNLSAELVDVPATKYFGTDEATYPERLPQKGLLATKVPLWIGYAAYDPLSFEKQFNHIQAALCQVNRCPSNQIFAHHSHMSELYSINSDDTTVSDALLQFIGELKSKR
jgi:triacylglycerol lipase